MPFPTALLAEHLAGPEARTATAIYSGMYFMIALAFNGLWWHVVKRRHLFLASADQNEIKNITRKDRFGPLFYLISFGLAFVSVAASVAMCLALAIFFAISGRPAICDA